MADEITALKAKNEKLEIELSVQLSDLDRAFKQNLILENKRTITALIELENAHIRSNSALIEQENIQLGDFLFIHIYTQLIY